MDQPDDQNSKSVSCLDEPQTNNNETNQDNRPMSESSEEKNEPESPKTPKKTSYEEFLDELKKHESPEQKISHVLQYMEKAISQGGAPSFKNFWDARKLCLTFFKEENLSFSVRSHLWSRYVELSKEAHKLKEVLDEQSAFAAEQIDLAIKGLEEDIEKLDDKEFQMPEVAFDTLSKFLEPKIDEYKNVQKELALLNAYAAKINSLRKELIKTEMRIRVKNNFFQRLSAAGDKIFPRRKELIKTISQIFIEDVKQFIEQNFSDSKIKQPFYFLREEIKALQGVAKILTLNTQAFNQTRMKLSECWDKIKKIEKEKKKEKAKLKAVFQENANQVVEKIEALETQYKEGGLTDAQALSQIQEISQFMRQVQLGRDDIKTLRDRLSQVRADINDKATAAEKERLRLEKEKRDEILQQGRALIDAVKTLIAEIETRPVDEASQEIDRLTKEMAQLNPSKLLQNDFERQLQVFNDKISEQKIRNLPKDDQEAYEQLRIYLAENKKRRNEIKEKLESYRKANGVSGLDMEQALKQRELVAHEKERLEKVDEEIDHILERIKELEQNS